MGPVFDKRTEIFALSLDPKAQFPFAPTTELSVKSDDEAETGVARVKVKWDKIEQRLWQVPVPAGNYYGLQAAEKQLYLLEEQNDSSNLLTLKLSNKDPKTTEFAKDVGQFELAKDGKNLMLRKQSDPKQIMIVPAGDKAPKDVTQAMVNTASWQLSISPQLEWQQMFEDAWLMHRDSFYDVNMRGIDWQASKTKYQPLLDRVTERAELNDIFKQMMGELDSLHSQVRGGDISKDPNQPKPASLGARLTQTDNGVRIDHIYQSDPELPAMAGPLAKVNVDAKLGDIIVAINGKAVNNVADVTHLLRNQADEQVLLELKRGRKQHQTVVVPYGHRDDAYKRYSDWVYHNASKVKQASSGDIGYLHLNAMGANDIANFAREFYTNYDKQGLIIDVRRNRGGNIDSWIIEKLLRKAWAFWQPTHGSAHANMQQTFRGHLVVLADQMTYSDGETFSAGVKALGIAPIIGKQTAGAGVWLSGRNSLTDKGMARVAEYPQYAIDGRWVLEGHGVAPDIEVDNLPFATFQGKDAQLETAIQYLKDEMVQQPITPLKALPMPTRGKAEDIK